MSLPRKHIAEGIAVAIMVGVGGVIGALANGDRRLFGEPYLFVAGHALPNPSEEDVRRALASPLGQLMRQIVSDRHVDAGEVERMFKALRKDRVRGECSFIHDEEITFADGDPSGVEPIRIRERQTRTDDNAGITLTSKHGRCYEVVPEPVSARLVETIIPARRCSAPGCGDKIKDTETYEITWSDGSILHIDSGCVDWFVNGHPDYGCGRGTVPGLPS